MRIVMSYALLLNAIQMRRAVRGRLLSLVVAAVLTSTASPALAQAPSVLFSQSPDYPSAFSAWTSSTPLTSFFTQGFQTFDDFTLPQTALINTIQWQGLYIDLGTPTNNPIAPNPFAWGISFATDAGGVPGVTLTQIFSPFAVVQSFAGQAFIAGSIVNVYNFSLTMATPFVAQAGTRYWFSPISVQPNANTLYAWMTGAGGTNGSGVSHQYLLTASGRSLEGTRGDMAFTLIGAAAPEPPTATLLLLSLLGMGQVYRSRQSRLHR